VSDETPPEPQAPTTTPSESVLALLGVPEQLRPLVGDTHAAFMKRMADQTAIGYRIANALERYADAAERLATAAERRAK
jgi:hypothetical protein